LIPFGRPTRVMTVYADLMTIAISGNDYVPDASRSCCPNKWLDDLDFL
jgi:hypothetical protein